MNARKSKQSFEKGMDSPFLSLPPLPPIKRQRGMHYYDHIWQCLQTNQGTFESPVLGPVFLLNSESLDEVYSLNHNGDLI